MGCDCACLVVAQPRHRRHPTDPVPHDAQQVCIRESCLDGWVGEVGRLGAERHLLTFPGRTMADGAPALKKPGAIRWPDMRSRNPSRSLLRLLAAAGGAEQ